MRSLQSLALLLGFTGVLACSDAPVGDNQTDAQTPDAAPPLPCTDTSDCPQGYRCEEDRCIIGWTITSLPGTWGGGCFPGPSYPLTIDSDGNVYLAGTFQGDVDFDPGEDTHIHSSQGSTAGFLLKLDSNGEYV